MTDTDAELLSADEREQIEEHIGDIVGSLGRMGRDYMSRAFLAKWEWEEIARALQTRLSGGAVLSAVNEAEPRADALLSGLKVGRMPDGKHFPSDIAAILGFARWYARETKPAEPTPAPSEVAAEVAEELAQALAKKFDGVERWEWNEVAGFCVGRTGGTGAELAQGMVCDREALIEWMQSNVESFVPDWSDGNAADALISSGIIIAVPGRHEIKAILDDFETNDGRADALLSFITGRVAK